MLVFFRGNVSRCHLSEDERSMINKGRELRKNLILRASWPQSHDHGAMEDKVYVVFLPRVSYIPWVISSLWRNFLWVTWLMCKMVLIIEGQSSREGDRGESLTMQPSRLWASWPVVSRYCTNGIHCKWYTLVCKFWVQNFRSSDSLRSFHIICSLFIQNMTFTNLQMCLIHS